MIGFSCENCGHSFSVQDDYLGKRIKCPKCNYVGEVIDDSGRIQVTCQNCGNENNVPETLVGKEVQCPKCNNPVVVLSLKEEPPENVEDYLLGNFHKKPENVEDYLLGNFHKKPEQPKISDKNLIIIISFAAAFIVLAQIIFAVISIPPKSRNTLKARNPQRQRQINNTRQTERNFQDSEENSLRLRDVLKLDKNIIILCAIAITCIIVLFCRLYFCPECRKMWAMQKIDPFIESGGINEYVCKHCGYRKRTN
jgi:DNA-directed RNA polymerase subunit RPC12/RpoP